MTTTSDPIGTVFATQGGDRFHKTSTCSAVASAQLIWDSDEFEIPAYAPMEIPFTTAMGDGKEPCTFCFPGLRAAWYRGSSEEDYGHEPVARVLDGWDGPQSSKRPVCARCIRHVRKWSSWTVGYDERAGVQWENGWLHLQFPAPWPCTSAIVLGLVPREVTA
ncbi:hypothetical protein OG785_45250 [Streptomyces sp. NBC_00006]|uniref:hypothetical protein n=1 Tax=Streptomyces sp. NBC_00006 TaxID=2975619 RepID=UPI00225AD273|nr:hypothetical protein [Streptomyces sp. NBC_00006]MCX5529001.1 hypothetical protein [Streptomyces sp. NBC_00006]MCX5537767.1 hypothetical protein [Streptomyces sp. NBC_00006]